VGEFEAALRQTFFIARGVELETDDNDLYAVALDKTGSETRDPATGYHVVTLDDPPDPSLSYIYDDNGCLVEIKEGATTLKEYVYDYENRVVEVKHGGTPVAAYQYDGLGRRIKSTVGSVVTRFIYDGDAVLEEYAWDTQSSSWVLAAVYVHGIGVDNAISIERDGEIYYYHYDGYGSVSELTDEDGALAQAYEYDAWGIATIYDPESAIENPYLYTGRRWDAAISLYYYRARHYAPTLGRFLQPDPIGYGDGTNLYVYVAGTPTVFIDPSGMEKLKIRRRRAEWIVQKEGLLCDSTYDRVDVGVVKNGMLHLREEYGGGVISVKSAKGIVRQHECMWGLAGSKAAQRAMKEAFAGRGLKRESLSMLDAAGQGAGEGALDGATVIADHATLNLIGSLHERSLKVQARAARNGDVLSQVGFGLGKVGVEAAYAAAGLKAGSLIGRGAARVAPRLVGTLNKAKPVLQGIGIVSGTANTVGSGYVSYEAFEAGDYNTAAHMAGRTVISGILTGATIKDTFGGNKPQTGKQTGSYTNRHASGKKYHGKGPPSRARTTANQIAKEHNDPLVDTDWKPAANDQEAFIDEAWRIRNDGGVDNPYNYNKINSPGHKFIKHLFGE